MSASCVALAASPKASLHEAAVVMFANWVLAGVSVRVQGEIAIPGMLCTRAEMLGKYNSLGEWLSSEAVEVPASGGPVTYGKRLLEICNRDLTSEACEYMRIATLSVYDAWENGYPLVKQAYLRDRASRRHDPALAEYVNHSESGPLTLLQRVFRYIDKIATVTISTERGTSVFELRRDVDKMLVGREPNEDVQLFRTLRRSNGVIILESQVDRKDNSRQELRGFKFWSTPREFGHFRLMLEELCDAVKLPGLNVNFVGGEEEATAV